MKKITPCLWFHGDAEKALKFYKSVFKKFKVKERLERDGKLLFGSFEILGQNIMFINQKADFRLNTATSLFVSCKDQKEVDYYWKKLSAGGEEDCCGWLRDRFGLSWQIIPTDLIRMNSHRDRKKAERSFQAMLKMKKIDIAALKKAFNSK